MKKVEKMIFKFDKNRVKYFVNDKEVEQDTWIFSKSTWESARSYSAFKKYVDKWGFTDCECYEKDNVYIWAFTTTK